VTRFRPPRPIADGDGVEVFRCGDAALDDWLQRRAKRNEGSGASRTFVTIDDNGEVAGYYCLAAAALPRSRASTRARRNMPDPLPAFVLGRLAVDQRYQGIGLGQNLLRDAIRRSLAAAEIIGARLLLVHAATDDAASFYAHFDFEPSPTDPMHLLLVLADARRAGLG
jgi:GNAT superfamily N-acetyltransferase